MTEQQDMPRAGDGELTLLSGMLDREIEREGEMHSFMVRAGLLRAIIDELQTARAQNMSGPSHE